MKQFCEEVLKFLRSEYDDSYGFDIELRRARPPIYDMAELTITVSPNYKLKIVNDSMQYLFGWYINKEYLGERNQYRWQKELIDMIEGG